MSNARRDYCTLDNLVSCSCWRGETAPANHLRPNLTQCGPFHHALPCLLQPPANAWHRKCCVHVAQLLLKPRASWAGFDSRPSPHPLTVPVSRKLTGGQASLYSAFPLALLLNGRSVAPSQPEAINAYGPRLVCGAVHSSPFSYVLRSTYVCLCVLFVSALPFRSFYYTHSIFRPFP